eukprot:Rhum_TRINITY_DN5624_c0_g1::Rhum_TRINITY_DN5624_c0_g1_i1::g.17911::m.17911
MLDTLELAKGVAFATGISAFALWRRSLNARGTAAAWLVFGVAWTASRWHVAVLLVFFFGSSFLTKVGKATKMRREEGYAKGGAGRNEWQVLANGGLGTALAAAWVWTREPALLLGYLVQYAACGGDTWASEVGILSAAQPRLIVGFRRVPHGTNGGVTPLGTAASVCGGAVVGLASSVLSPPAALPDVGFGGGWAGAAAVGALGGFVGSCVDSVLGQFLEYSAWNKRTSVVTYDASGSPTGGEREHITGRNLLSGGHVNFLSTLITTSAAMAVVYTLGEAKE